jgi:hypothetical protein
LAAEMIAILNGASFENKPVRDGDGLVNRAWTLVDKVQEFAARGE